MIAKLHHRLSKRRVRHARDVFCWTVLCLIPLVVLSGTDTVRSADTVWRDTSPVLRLQADGPLAPISQMVFTTDGNTLYAAGQDKVIHAWSLERSADGSQRFRYNRDLVRRVPIAPGPWGNLNALDISPDGKWLATGGMGPMAQAAGFRSKRILNFDPEVFSLSEDDEGLIHLFDTTKPNWQPDSTLSLSGHAGEIRGLAFVELPQPHGKTGLVSVAQTGEPGNEMISIRVWDFIQQKMLKQYSFDLPRGTSFYRNCPGDVTAWADEKELKVAFCSSDHGARPKPHVFNLQKDPVEDEMAKQNPPDTWCCCWQTLVGPQERHKLLVGTLPRIEGQTAELQQWDGQQFQPKWSSKENEQILCIQPVDANRAAVLISKNNIDRLTLLTFGTATQAQDLLPNPLPQAISAPHIAVSHGGISGGSIAIGTTAVHLWPPNISENPKSVGQPLKLALGETFKKLCFVQHAKDDGIGLWLADQSGATVLDFSKGKLDSEASNGDWASWEPQTAGWEIRKWHREK